MNKLLFVLVLFLIGCDDNTVTITKEEYRKLKGDTSKVIEPKIFKIGEKNRGRNKFIVELGSDGHEYAHNIDNSYEAYVAFHYVDCQLCKSRLNEKP